MKKKDFSTIALIIVFFVGVSVLLYPTVSDYWNSLHQSQAIATYADSVEKMDEQDYETLWDAAVSYNQKLFQSGHGLGLKDEEKEEYNEYHRAKAFFSCQTKQTKDSAGQEQKIKGV